MSPANLAATAIVPLLGVAMCVTPAVTRPTIQFGVRVPAEHASAAVISRQRRAYYRRTAAIAACCTAAVVATAIATGGHGPWWPARVILLVEVAANLGSFLRARKVITAAKNDGQWFSGRRQVVVTDTSWRTSPARYPVLWLTPAVTVIAATALIGALRYPGLHSSPVRFFGALAAQLYVTALCSVLTLLAYRSRPDVDAADPATAIRRYRRFLAAVTKALLTLAAAVNLSVLLGALRTWHIYQPRGAGTALPALPFAAGLIVFLAVAMRAGQGGYRLSAGRSSRPSTAASSAAASSAAAATADRDDDRFWKAGLIYVNRDDPSVMVGARFGVGWTLNLGNPVAWLVIAGIVSAVAGLAALRALAG